MTTKLIVTSLVSLLLLTGALYYVSTSTIELEADFHGNLTPTEHMLCRAEQFHANDYNNCLNLFRDYTCQTHYFNFLNEYRQDETQFYDIYLLQPADIKGVVQGWNKSCNTFEHYRRCGWAESIFTKCVFGNELPECSLENTEYIAATMLCQNVPDRTPIYDVDEVQAQCMMGIVGLAKGQLAEALACS